MIHGSVTEDNRNLRERIAIAERLTKTRAGKILCRPMRSMA